MKNIASLLIVIFSIAMSACGPGNRSEKSQAVHEDSIRSVNYHAFQMHLSALRAVREEFKGPIEEGSITVAKGVKFKTNIMDDSTSAITNEVEKLNAKMEHAQKDSTTIYGALLTRFKLLKTQNKYLTATYTNGAHLLRFTSEITIDDKHEEDKDFYFDNASLVYFRERHTFTADEQRLMTDDSYFLRDGRVVYAYRDEGSGQDSKDRMNIMSMKRFLLTGNLTAHISKEFGIFKSDYEILLLQPLEPLLYP
jgi:hypothetical protein